MDADIDLNQRPGCDVVLQNTAGYVLGCRIDSAEALDTTRNCLVDTLGYGLLALYFPECIKHFGPLVGDTLIPHGARVPGTSFQLDPVKIAQDIDCTVHWLDYNDAWLAARWGHPSGNFGDILIVADHLSQKHLANGEASLSIRQILGAMIMAREVQGVITLENSLNRVDLDHVLLIKVASTAVYAELMEADREQLLATFSRVFVDGQALHTYRHVSNAGSRKSRATGNVTGRSVRLADIILHSKMSIPGVLSTP